jgi:NTE family protein
MPPLENIVLSGGGILGLSYPGVFKFMEEVGIQMSIKRVLGVSVGSILGLLFVLRIPSDQMRQLFDQFTPDDIKDINTENILHFFEVFGIDTGIKIESFIKACAKVRLGNPDATFADLYEKHPDMEYIAMGAEITQSQRVYFSYKNTPTVPLWKAIRISCSVPLYFQPVIDGKNVYVDGGVVCNYPIDYFRDDLKHTIGITFLEYTASPSVDICDDISANMNQTNKLDFYTYFIHVFETMTYTFERHMVKHYEDYTVRVKIPKRAMSDYALDKEMKLRYYNAGYSSMKDYWEQRCAKYKLEYQDGDDDADDVMNDSTDVPVGDELSAKDLIDIESITMSMRENTT